jgi:hypothetical protein
VVVVRDTAFPRQLEERPWREARERGALSRQLRLVGVARLLREACEIDVSWMTSLGQRKERLEAKDALERADGERGRCQTPSRRGLQTATAAGGRRRW